MLSDFGSIKNKKPMIDIIRKYKSALLAISLIHRIGTRKYELFSWYNKPVESDSTVENNINAMIRHFSAHRSGVVFDSESHLPHLFHLACRCAMLITTYYKEKREDYTRSKIDDGRPYCDDALIGCMITGEELISLSKPCKDYSSCTRTELEIAIANKLFKLALVGETDVVEDIINDITEYDVLFNLVCNYLIKNWDDPNTKLREHINYCEFEDMRDILDLMLQV